MKNIRRHRTTVGATVLVGVLASGCGAAESETGPTSDAGSPSDTGPRLPQQPTSSESAGEGSDSQQPVLLEDKRNPVDPDLERLVQRFVRYAVGDSDIFPLQESVSMSLGGEPVVAIDDIVAALPQRRIWRICPADWQMYGASSCPVDLLAPINDAVVNEASLVYSAAYDDVVCAPTRTGRLPRGRLVVLRFSDEWRSCGYDFALVLAADDQGRLGVIDLTLSEP